MLYRAKAIVSKGPKELGSNRTRTADLNLPEGYSILYDIMLKEFWRQWVFILLSSARWGASWASARGCWVIACASLVIYIHIYISIVITITLFLFSISVNSFILTINSTFFFFFFPNSLTYTTGKGIEWANTLWCSATYWVNHNSKQGINPSVLVNISSLNKLDS